MELNYNPQAVIRPIKVVETWLPVQGEPEIAYSVVSHSEVSK